MIRGQALPNKKELYFNGVKQFLQDRSIDLVKAVAKHFSLIQENRYIQAHIVRSSDSFISFLQQEKLQTVFDNTHMYSRDYNSSYNKIDTFITKTISVFDMQGTLILEGNSDVLATNTLQPGEYTMHIQYAMNIPDTYKTFIATLEKQYAISLQVREKHILALYPERSTRGVVYMPNNYILTTISGPTKQQQIFTTPFSHNAFYVLENTVNNSMKEVVLSFSVQGK